ncbi:DapH/DapD/GlmU-related protein [Vibrio splendidus]
MRIKGYGIFALLYLSLCLLYTKIFFRKARIVRLPFRLRNQGNLCVGNNFVAGVNCRVDVFSDGNLNFGDNVQLNDDCHIACSDEISIGDNCLIASKVYITDHDHDYTSQGRPDEWPLRSSAVFIGNDSWIGEGVCILKGVSIGAKSVVGANSVVTKNVPSGSIVAGNPARVIGIKSNEL